MSDIGFPFSRLPALALLLGLTGCGVEPLPPLKLMDAGAYCEHLRQSDPELFRHCVRDIGFGNELRIESRQNYLRHQAEDWEPTPLPSMAAPYTPPLVVLSAPPAAPTPPDPVLHHDYITRPPPTVLCVGQVAIPGGSNAEGMRLGCK
jgi:hypothetical protein